MTTWDASKPKMEAPIMKRLLPAFCLVLPLLVACQPTSPAADGSPVLSYQDAFIMAPIGGRDVTMGGIEVSVEGGDIRLVSVETDIAEAVETHSMEMVDGKMTMRPVEGYPVKPGEPLDLDRGGNHLMLFGVSEGLTAGQTVDMTLTFEAEDGEILTLVAEAEIRALGE